MKHLIKFNELTKNKVMLKTHLRKMLDQINQYEKLTRTNVEYQIDGYVSHKLEIRNLDSKSRNNILSILKKYKNILSKDDIIMSYKDYPKKGFDFDDDLNMSPNDEEYIDYIIYFKNLHTKRIKPNKLVYHYSDPKNRNSILENGLNVKSHNKSDIWSKEIELEYSNAIFAVNSDDTWRKEDKWEIDTQKIKNKWWEDLNFNNRKDLIMTFENIPKEAIKLVD